MDQNKTDFNNLTGYTVKNNMSGQNESNKMNGIKRIAQISQIKFLLKLVHKKNKEIERLSRIFTPIS